MTSIPELSTQSQETWHEERVLILAKTYPVPSAKYRETSCIAGVNEQGQMRRIYPIPFRLLEGQSQFKKWQWIRARMRKAPADHRPESFKIEFDSIADAGGVIPTKSEWSERRAWYERHLVSDFTALEERRQASGETLGIIRPTRLLGLDITPEKETDWTPEEYEKLVQDCLFDSEEARGRLALQKIPFGFHFRYECDGPSGTTTHRHKIADWEVGQLYRNCVRLYGDGWEEKVRQKLEDDFAQKDLAFLMGTIHRFPGQWLIGGLIYPPFPTVKPAPLQASLFE